MTAYQRVAVLLGGRSAEREVSLVSGEGCAQALRDEGFDVVEIDAGDDLARQLATAQPDAVFNALHGRWGEDGCVQGLLELMRIPYTHSGVLASALAMHKQRAKDVFRAAGLPVVKSIVVDRREASAQHLMEPPYVVKPVSEGSSVGVFIIRKGELWTSGGGYCLAGITRDSVLRAARRAGIPAFEKDFSLFDVYGADEAFCTGTFAGLTPIVKIDGRPIGEYAREPTDASGPMTKRLRALYKALETEEARGR